MLPVQFALAAPPSDHDSIGLISHLPLAVQFPLGATRSISMLTRVIREMQLSLISMLTRSLTGRPNDGSAGSSSPPLKQQPHTMGGAQAAAAPEAPEAPEAPPKKKAKAAPERGTGLGRTPPSARR